MHNYLQTLGGTLPCLVQTGEGFLLTFVRGYALYMLWAVGSFSQTRGGNPPLSGTDRGRFLLDFVKDYKLLLASRDSFPGMCGRMQTRVKVPSFAQKEFHGRTMFACFCFLHESKPPPNVEKSWGIQRVFRGYSKGIPIKFWVFRKNVTENTHVLLC